MSDTTNEIVNAAETVISLDPQATAFLALAKSASGLFTAAMAGFEAVTSGQTPTQQYAALDAQQQKLLADKATLDAMKS